MNTSQSREGAGRRPHAIVSTSIEPELDRFLELYAAATGTTKAEIVRRALYEYLYRRGYVVKTGGGRYVLAPNAMERLARRIAAMR